MSEGSDPVSVHGSGEVQQVILATNFVRAETNKLSPWMVGS